MWFSVHCGTEQSHAKLLLEILENATNATFVKCHTPSQTGHFYLIATKTIFYSEIFSIPDLHECKPRAQIKPWGNDSTCIQFISLGEETGWPLSVHLYSRHAGGREASAVVPRQPDKGSAASIYQQCSHQRQQCARHCETVSGQMGSGDISALHPQKTSKAGYIWILKARRARRTKIWFQFPPMVGQNSSSVVMYSRNQMSSEKWAQLQWAHE